MRGKEYGDLLAFMAVARERSFSRAAAQLGVSPSALSHAMRGLEERLSVRLLTRTTRRVAPTEAGEQLIERIASHFVGIDTKLEAMRGLSERPAGNVRITADENAVHQVLWPKLGAALRAYPEITIELITDYGLTDIVADRFDAGVRIGEIVAKDMIAVPIGPDMRMAVVAAPAYFADRPRPRVPQDLTSHNCNNLRLPTLGGVYAWEFEKGGKEVRVRVQGQATFNSIGPILQATIEGHGIAYLAADQVRPHIADDTLIGVLEDWTPPFAGYHLYYPSRRQPTAAFKVVLDALRFRERP